MADRVSYPQYDPSHDYHFVPPLHAVKVDATKGGGSKGRRRSGGMMRRIVFAFLFVGSALLAAEILFQTVLAPRMAIRKIIIESDLPFSQEYLLRSAGINEGDLYFSVDTQKIQEQLSSIPLVEQAEVEKRFPGQLRMVLHKRTPLAVAAMSGSQGPLVIDANGVVFQQGYPRDYKSLPVLSGFEVANIELGASLPAAMRVALSDLEVLRMHHPVLFNLISEIEYEMVHERRFDMVLYFTHVRFPVMVGSRLVPEKISGIIRILEVLRRQGVIDDILEIDFRGDEVLYTRREG